MNRFSAERVILARDRLLSITNSNVVFIHAAVMDNILRMILRSSLMAWPMKLTQRGQRSKPTDPLARGATVFVLTLKGEMLCTENPAMVPETSISRITTACNSNKMQKTAVTSLNYTTPRFS